MEAVYPWKVTRTKESIKPEASIPGSKRPWNIWARNWNVCVKRSHCYDFIFTCAFSLIISNCVTTRTQSDSYLHSACDIWWTASLPRDSLHHFLTEDRLYSIYFGKVLTFAPWSISYPGGIVLQHAATYFALPSHRKASILQALYSTVSFSSSGFPGKRLTRRPHFTPASAVSSEWTISSADNRE